MSEWNESTTWHAGNGDLFAPAALCGATASDEPDGRLRVHSVSIEVTCPSCRRITLERE